MRTPTEERVLADALAEAVTKLSWFGQETPLYIEAPSGHEVVPTHELLAQENLRGYFLRAIREWSARLRPS